MPPPIVINPVRYAHVLHELEMRLEAIALVINLPLEAMACLCQGLLPEVYGDPPTPEPCPATAGSAAKLAALEGRAGTFALFNKNDGGTGQARLAVHQSLPGPDNCRCDRIADAQATAAARDLLMARSLAARGRRELEQAKALLHDQERKNSQSISLRNCRKPTVKVSNGERIWVQLYLFDARTGGPNKAVGGRSV